MFHKPGIPQEAQIWVTMTHGGGSELQEEIKDVIEGLEGVVQIEDNIVIHGKGEEHDEKLRKLLNSLQNKGQTLRVEKGEFGAAKTTWCGFICDKDGIRDNNNLQQRKRHTFTRAGKGTRRPRLCVPERKTNRDSRKRSLNTHNGGCRPSKLETKGAGKPVKSGQKS